MKSHAEAVLARLRDTRFAFLIDGKLESGDTTFDVVDPSRGVAVLECPDASREQLERTVAAARRAFPAWRDAGFAARRKAVERFADAVIEHRDELAETLTTEQGKPLADAHREIDRSVAIMRALVAIDIAPDILRNDPGGRVELHYKPVGVVAGIAPWNVPVVLAAPKIAAALYTGNTMLLKPSPYTPLTTLRLGALARDIFPAGVLNVLAGGNDLGAWMTEHADIDMITFTGSVPTGKRVLCSGADNLKRVTLELGGNDAAIVLNDVRAADIAAPLFKAAFSNSGQICQSIKRLYVHDDIYEEMVQALASLARSAKVGGGFEPGVEYGPVQNEPQFRKVLDILADTQRLAGVRIVAGGGAIDRPGYFIAPTIVADIAEGTRIVDEEPFGPVLPVMRFTDLDDAIARANATPFGLGGSVWTSDVQHGAEIAARLETGVAWVNHHLGVSPEYPFGGVKQSGLGRVNGELGLKRNMETQLLVIPASQ